jgi:hypothetical protein
MRTGNINVQGDYTTALWFGNGWFHAIDPASTTKFNVTGGEADATARWKTGHVSAFGGYFRYNDNDTTADNSRGIYYYAVEAVQDLSHKFYVASRFSQVLCPRGYSLVGFGNMGQYFNGEQTKSLWRWSLGGGYRFSNRLAVKAEYSFERGRETDGSLRNHEDFVSTEAVFKF